MAKKPTTYRAFSRKKRVYIAKASYSITVCNLWAAFILLGKTVDPTGLAWACALV